MRKISILELEKLLREGNGVSECARKLGVTKGAVSKRLKALKVAITKDVALHHAGEIVEKKLDAIAQLQKINDYANELLDLLMRWNRGDETALQILESQVRKVKIGKGEDAQEVTEYKFKDPRELALKAMGEIRGQLSLQLEIFKALYDMAAVAEFQKEVLESIKEVAPDVRDKSFTTYKKEELFDQLLTSIDREILGGRGITLEEMISTFEKGEGEYRNFTVMSLVVAILQAGNGEGLKKELPARLVDFFVETLKQRPPCEGYRERREGESEKDYLAYKILECKAIAGAPELKDLSDDELDRLIAQETGEMAEEPEPMKNTMERP